MRGLIYRVFLVIINILFPPLGVLMLCGFDWDLVLNCCLFLLAIIPGHIHAFYISCTYFHRRRKVKRGQYPGGPKPMIKSKNVINGGASDREVERLYMNLYNSGAGQRRYDDGRASQFSGGDKSQTYYHERRRW